MTNDNDDLWQTENYFALALLFCPTWLSSSL